MDLINEHRFRYLKSTTAEGVNELYHETGPLIPSDFSKQLSIVTAAGKRK